MCRWRLGLQVIGVEDERNSRICEWFVSLLIWENPNGRLPCKTIPISINRPFERSSKRRGFAPITLSRPELLGIQNFCPKTSLERSITLNIH